MSADKITPSDTPRTDAAVFAFDQNYLKVNADFARQLERENAALRAQLAERDAELAAIKGHAEAMHEQLRAMRLHFVNTLESARDSIRLHGGECDPVDEMERRDPQLAAALKVMDAYRAAFPKED